ncbi:hypothetical protein ACH4UY_07855 [Streptomyces longwoodensis]|uniref:hypothetical protein n=1 Tax=Streptomyces longwoodensis TaxID=68231 RepID=UPI00379AC9D8
MAWFLGIGITGVVLLGSTTGVDLAELLKGVTQRVGTPGGGERTAPLNGKVEITG